MVSDNNRKFANECDDDDDNNNNFTFSQTENTEQLQNCTPGNIVCFRQLLVNTLHKRDDNDDDDYDYDDDDDNNNNNNNNNNNSCLYTQTYAMVTRTEKPK